MASPAIIDRCDALNVTRGYIVASICRACGESSVSLFCLGQEPKSGDRDERCPQCECAGKLYHGTMQQAFALLEGQDWHFWYDDPCEGFLPCQYARPACIVTPRLPPSPVASTVTGSGNAKVYDA